MWVCWSSVGCATNTRNPVPGKEERGMLVCWLVCPSPSLACLPIFLSPTNTANRPTQAPRTTALQMISVWAGQPAFSKHSAQDPLELRLDERREPCFGGLQQDGLEVEHRALRRWLIHQRECHRNRVLHAVPPINPAW